MLDRQLIGDVVFAILLAVPTATLARPQGVPQIRTVEPRAAVVNAAAAVATTADRQVGLFR